MTGKTDATATPSTLVIREVCETNAGGTTPRTSFCFFVPSGLYFKVVGAVSGGSLTFVANKSTLAKIRGD